MRITQCNEMVTHNRRHGAIRYIACHLVYLPGAAGHVEPDLVLYVDSLVRQYRGAPDRVVLLGVLLELIEPQTPRAHAERQRHQHTEDRTTVAVSERCKATSPDINTHRYSKRTLQDNATKT